MPWAAFLLTVGFILREINAFNTDNIPLYIAEAVLIVSSPARWMPRVSIRLTLLRNRCLVHQSMLASTILVSRQNWQACTSANERVVLSRVLFYVPYLSPLHPGRVLTTFLAADALCEILIINGVQKIVDSRFDEKTREIGNALTKSGLILQVIMFGLFVLLAAVFHTRARKRGVCTKNIRTVLIILYISCTIITARCIYRIVEFFEYGSGPLHDSEAYFWVFEATIMFINTAMLNVWHPGKYLPRSNKVFLSMDGKTEIRGPGYKETRPFIATLLDPFDITGLITGRDAKTKFWDWTPEELERIDQENEQKKLEKDRLPRATWKKVLDPLHMFDHKGRIVRFAKTLEKPTDRQAG